MKTGKEKCGCVYEIGERERWVKLCPAHETEFQKIHAQWAIEHQQAQERKPQ